MTTPTAQDIVTATQAAVDQSRAALDVALAFAGQPTTTDQMAALQAQVTQLTADKQALQAKLDAVRTARQAEEAGEVAADTARAKIDAALA